MTEEWAAGLFDGEGCVDLGYQTHGGVRYRMTLEMNHAPTVKKFAEIVGGGTVRKTNHGTTVWSAVALEAARAAEELYAYSLTKKKDIERLLKIAKLVASRPKGYPTPVYLRKKYDKLILENRK